MSKPTQPQQSPQPPSQASSDQTAESSGNIKKPEFTATASTKYDVLPPRPQQPHASTPPTSLVPLVNPSLMPLAQPSPMTTSATSGPKTVVSNSAQLLASARAKLAATKKASTPSPSTPSPDPSVQLFEITHLKTIKCDVCQQKNGDILYKCQNCNAHHQICSRCVENTNPTPTEGSLGRKDWSVHAKLKDAHAAYIRPISPGKHEDGSYDGNGVKFVVLQGKKGGLKKASKTNTKKDVTLGDRNATVRRGVGASNTAEQARRIAEAARAKIERGQSEELKERVAAARASMDMRDKSEAGSQGQSQAGDRKRKADVLDVKDADLDGEKGDEDTTQVDRDEGFDEVETAASVKESLRDIGLPRSGLLNRRNVQNPTNPRRGTFSPIRSALPPFRDVQTARSLSSAGLKPPLVGQANQASVSDPFVSPQTTIKASRGPLPLYSPPGFFTPPSQPRPSPSMSKMRITARKPNSSKTTKHSVHGLLQPWRSRDPEPEVPSKSSSMDSLHEVEATHPKHLEQPPNLTVPEQRFPLPRRPNKTEESKQRRQRIRAQRELQYITEEDNGKADPFAQDVRGIDMLLLAAKMIEDQARAQIQQQERQRQIHRSPPGAPDQSPRPSGERFQDPSEFDWLSNTPPPPPRGTEIPTTSSTLRPPPPPPPQPLLNNLPAPNRRRIEVLTSATYPDLAPYHRISSLTTLPPVRHHFEDQRVKKGRAAEWLDGQGEGNGSGGERGEENEGGEDEGLEGGGGWGGDDEVAGPQAAGMVPPEARYAQGSGASEGQEDAGDDAINLGPAPQDRRGRLVRGHRKSENADRV